MFDECRYDHDVIDELISAAESGDRYVIGNDDDEDEHEKEAK